MNSNPRSTRVKASTNSNFGIDVNPYRRINDIITPTPLGRVMIENKDKQSFFKYNKNNNKKVKKTINNAINHKKYTCNIKCKNSTAGIPANRIKQVI